MVVSKRWKTGELTWWYTSSCGLPPNTESQCREYFPVCLPGGTANALASPSAPAPQPQKARRLASFAVSFEPLRESNIL